MDNFLTKTRAFTIKIFEYVILASLVIGVLASIIVGIGQMFNPYMSAFMGLLMMISGIIGTFAASGAAFLLVGIYHNTKQP